MAWVFCFGVGRPLYWPSNFKCSIPVSTPFIFTLPSATVIRYFWDIIFFLLLLGHLRTLRKRYLFGAAVCCGVQIFYMTTIGYCLTIAFLAYMAAFMIVGHLRPLVCKKVHGCCLVLRLFGHRAFDNRASVGTYPGPAFMGPGILAKYAGI